MDITLLAESHNMAFDIIRAARMCLQFLGEGWGGSCFNDTNHRLGLIKHDELVLSEYCTCIC